MAAFLFVGRANLTAFFHKHDVVVGLIAIDKVPEAFQFVLILQRGFPFALISVDDMLHLLFQFARRSRVCR